MPNFKTISSSDPIKEIIKSAFDMDVDLTGGWGYTQESATIIHSTNDLPVEQFEHTLTTMRAYIEMNMTLEASQRYGSINPTETKREVITMKDKTYHKVYYEITAMQEDLYAKFINEYKSGYGTADFDMSEHFKRRKKATLVRQVVHWFRHDFV